MANTHSVSYQFRYDNNAPLLAYYEAANRAGAETMEFFLNLWGGIKPTMLTHAKYRTAKKSEKNGENKTRFPDAVILFHHWFSLEDKDGADPRLVVQVPDVMPRFKSYLNNVPVDAAWLDALQATVNSIYFDLQPDEEPDRVWVDRHRGFLEMNKKLGFTEATLNWIFSNPLLYCFFYSRRQFDISLV